MKREQIINSIMEYFKANEDVFNSCIEELDSYNGYLGDDRYYYMDELDELYCDTKASEVLTRAYFGYDEDSYYTDQYGQKHYDAFNPNRDYFKYNGYGNLVSADYRDYSDHLDEWAIEQMYRYRSDIYSIDEDTELSELFDKLDELEEDEEE